MTFLEEELVSLPGAILVASHDRVLLEKVCTSIVDLDPAHVGTDGHGGRRFGGSYGEHLTSKRAARRRWEEAFADQSTELHELQRRAGTSTSEVAHGRGPRDNDRFIHAFMGSWVQVTQRRRVRDAARRIERMERHLVPKPPEPLRFSGRLGGEGSDPGVSATTLLRKAQGDGLVPDGTSLVDLGLLHPRDLTRPVGTLSLGQQRRVSLALVIAARPDLVLLDEPTNHLSLTLVDELEQELLGGPVTVVVASHDRWLRHRWPGRLTPLSAS